MSRKANPVLIGAFVLGAAALFLIGIVVVGGSALLQPTTRFVMFFQGDVNGLRVGAPVTFRGVPVGKVTDIRASFRRVGEDGIETRIAVYAELDRRAIEAQEDLHVADPSEEIYRLLIESGLRAQLQWQSVVTGQLFVELDFHPDEPAIFVGGDPDVRELPTIPPPLEMVARTLRTLLERVGELPLEEIIENLNRTLEGTGRLVNSEATQGAIENLNAAMVDLSAVVARLGERIDDVADSAEVTLARANETLTAATRALESAQGAVGQESELRYQLEQFADEATAAARALRVLAETLERNPEALLSGKGEWER